MCMGHTNTHTYQYSAYHVVYTQSIVCMRICHHAPLVLLGRPSGRLSHQLLSVEMLLHCHAHIVRRLNMGMDVVMDMGMGMCMCMSYLYPLEEG
ncbi:hypothetical protein EON63_23685 [archaeon]|nr:MAG: hypothetical protein EON63_23685 [archaeon]